MDIIKNVYDFQTEVLGNPYPDKPIKLEGDRKKQALVKLQEELDELEVADKTSDQADALIDLIYFALGELHQMGVPAHMVWSTVHNANMRKVRGQTKRGFDNDANKPEDWKAPDHTWLDEEVA